MRLRSPPLRTSSLEILLASRLERSPCQKMGWMVTIMSREHFRLRSLKLKMRRQNVWRGCPFAEDNMYSVCLVLSVSSGVGCRTETAKPSNRPRRGVVSFVWASQIRRRLLTAYCVSRHRICRSTNKPAPYSASSQRRLLRYISSKWR